MPTFFFLYFFNNKQNWKNQNDKSQKHKDDTPKAENFKGKENVENNKWHNISSEELDDYA